MRRTFVLKTPRAILGLLLLVVAYGLLVPGLTEPVLSVSGTVEKAKLVELGRELLKESGNLPGFVTDLADRVIDGMDVSGTVSAFEKTRSILGTASELHTDGHLPVALLIVLFSVVVPLAKALVLIAALSPLSPLWRRRLAAFANASGKWSMADVFVIAIFIAYLAGNGIRESRGLVDFEASLEVGFWYFLGYCLVSVLGTQLLSGALRQGLTTQSLAAPDTDAPPASDAPPGPDTDDAAATSAGAAAERNSVATSDADAKPHVTSAPFRPSSPSG